MEGKVKILAQCDIESRVTAVRIPFPLGQLRNDYGPNLQEVSPRSGRAEAGRAEPRLGVRRWADDAVEAVLDLEHQGRLAEGGNPRRVGVTEPALLGVVQEVRAVDAAAARMAEL